MTKRRVASRQRWHAVGALLAAWVAFSAASPLDLADESGWSLAPRLWFVGLYLDEHGTIVERPTDFFVPLGAPGGAWEVMSVAPTGSNLALQPTGQRGRDWTKSTALMVG